MLVCDNIVSFKELSVLSNGTNVFRIKLQKKSLIYRNEPHLIKISASTPLVLFS